MDDKLLTTTEVSQATGLAESTLRKQRMNPDFGLPYVKLGRRVCYRPSDVKAFVDARIRTSTSDVSAL